MSTTIPTVSESSDVSAAFDSRTPVDVGRRDRKKHATRRALRAAALRLVAERGFAHVTVEDIAQAVDVSTRTFFNYFPTKESAVIGADPQRIERMRLGLLQRPRSESALQALGSVLVEYAATISEEIDDLGEGREAWFQRFCVVRNDPDLLGAYVADVSEVEGTLVAALAEWLGADALLDPYPALVTATALAATRVAALHWSANGGRGSLSDLTAAALDCLSGGLADHHAISPAAVEPSTPQRPARRDTELLTPALRESSEQP